MKKLITPLFVSILMFSCTQNEGSYDAALLINKDSLIHNISILASDSFQGRKPFTPGETMTVDFLEHAFRSIGAAPGNGDSYIQEVPMVKITPQADAA